ncbi:hypothetical protein OJAV_G00159470 [Oryzias javanicus]|uniref:GTP-binding protein 10 n=1 Tax=Oryzias javanicus TaxID=123683 RepID=A0A437CJ18_ORYJA|nr:hypothetical protein OJAV_G00159470 [Oryzias javanicus]
MVHVSRICLRKYGNFVDNLRLYVRGGGGGMGLPRLGGQGGNGGDVWVVAAKNMTLKRIKDKYPQKRFVGGSGGNSSVRSLKGEKGTDMEVLAPVGIAVTTDAGRILGDLNEDGDRVLVAKGAHCRSGACRVPKCRKILSPESSVQCHTSNCELCIHNFETGDWKVMYPDYKQISVADLPGLIEGAYMNKGMGHKFLKHVERTKQLLFVVDVCGFQLASKTPFRSAFEAVQLLTKELELYKEEVASKPALLVVNKMDLPDAEDKLAELKEQLKNPEEFSDLLPGDMIPKNYLTFRHVLPVSAMTGLGIDHLKSCIRQSLDEEDTLESRDVLQEKLQALRLHSQ